jgi:hypothetical protein
LVSASCTRATFCFAVGFSSHTSHSDLSTLVERWNGTKWSIVTTRIVSDWTGVSCTSATACFAVDYVGRAARWNGRSWSTVPTPKPDPNQFEGFTFTGVSCSTPTSIRVDQGGTPPR